MSKFFNLSNFTLLTALALSTIAAWFAIAGLVAIFPAKATSIIVMGGAIELAKIVATVWLRNYWHLASWSFKLMLIPMVAISMLLTSMGTFGYLSSAHSQQSSVSGDVAASVALLDEKIKTQRENIEIARRALQQLDAQVNARLDRGTGENSAERAVTIRRQQTTERNTLLKEISDAQAVIAKLNEERAPLSSQLRKVEAEVGPLKYIAALIYGDNPDGATLERAVRWVIIMLVIVFDPFAIALVLAGNTSKRWTTDTTEEVKENKESTTEVQKQVKDFSIKDYPYLFKGGFGFKNTVPPQVHRPQTNQPEESVEMAPPPPQNWGTTLPDTGVLGEIFVKTDTIPHQVYKWSGDYWMNIDRSNRVSHMFNDGYMQYLIEQIDSGNYGVELLSDIEKDEIRSYLRTIHNGENIMQRTVG